MDETTIPHEEFDLAKVGLDVVLDNVFKGKKLLTSPLELESENEAISKLTKKLFDIYKNTSYNIFYDGTGVYLDDNDGRKFGFNGNGRVQIKVFYKDIKEIRKKTFETLNDYSKALPIFKTSKENFQIQEITYMFGDKKLLNFSLTAISKDVKSIVAIRTDHIFIYISRPILPSYDHFVNFLIKCFFLINKEFPYKRLSILTRTFNPPKIHIKGDKFFKDWLLKSRTIKNFLIRKVLPHSKKDEKIWTVI